VYTVQVCSDLNGGGGGGGRAVLRNCKIQYNVGYLLNQFKHRIEKITHVIYDL
jgi:hypothetical protein